MDIISYVKGAGKIRLLIDCGRYYLQVSYPELNQFPSQFSFAIAS